jgi:hypothetical protein
MSVCGYDLFIFDWSYNPLESILASSNEEVVPQYILDVDRGSEGNGLDLEDSGSESSGSDGVREYVREKNNLGVSTVLLVNESESCHDTQFMEQEGKMEPNSPDGPDLEIMDLDEDVICEDYENIENELSKVKLQSSKSPIVDALVYCALKKWGLELIEDKGDNIRFRVFDFHLYYKYSTIICAKQNPTEDMAARIKALRRWFPDFPTKRTGKMDDPFDITVQLPNKVDNKPKKIRDIIEKQRRLIGLQKVSRQR